MDLWIRSQNKKQLELVKHIEINHKQELDNSVLGLTSGTVDIEECYILVNGRNFGEYKTEQRAIEVLDEIQNLLIDRYVWDNGYYLGSDVFIPSKDAEIKALPRTCAVYQMPADDGVDNAD